MLLMLHIGEKHTTETYPYFFLLCPQHHSKLIHSICLCIPLEDGENKLFEFVLHELECGFYFGFSKFNQLHPHLKPLPQALIPILKNQNYQQK